MHLMRGVLCFAIAGAALSLAAACAKIEPPPGGPPDTTPPRLVATSPDSLSVLPGFDADVEFRFDEVISEGGAANLGTGTGDLERLILLSPSGRVPEVRWRRNRITVRPREGWQPNRVYRVELLPGVMDLRNNRATARGASAVLTFTTGAPAPTARLRGIVFDWTTARPAPGALIEAVLMPDSLVYRFTADSAGGFALAPLPEGRYVVFGSLDQDRDRERDARELFDSATVATADTGRVELWAFPHDTAGPRIREAQVRDSVSATIVFSQPLLPGDSIAIAAVSLRRLPDSTAVAVASLAPELRETLATPDAPAARADTAAARPDTAAARADTVTRPKAPSRPALSDRLVLRTLAPLPPGTRYLLTIRGVRNVNGVAADAVGTLIVPAPPARDSIPAARDSTPPSNDSTPPPVR
jgi:hypothetical protein